MIMLIGGRELRWKGHHRKAAEAGAGNWDGLALKCHCK